MSVNSEDIKIKTRNSDYGDMEIAQGNFEAIYIKEEVNDIDPDIEVREPDDLKSFDIQEEAENENVNIKGETNYEIEIKEEAFCSEVCIEEEELNIKKFEIPESRIVDGFSIERITADESVSSKNCTNFVDRRVKNVSNEQCDSQNNLQLQESLWRNSNLYACREGAMNENHTYGKLIENNLELKSLSDALSLHSKFVILTNINGDKEFKCSACDFITSYKSHLNDHLRVHTGEKPFECSYCDYKSRRKSHLTLHLRRHTGEKPFKCSICDYRAARKADVRLHMRSHTGEKPFKCSICNFSATNRSSLNVHVRTHTGEKPYKCSYCDYSAVRKSLLNFHIKRHTGEKPFKCDVCDFSTARRYHLKEHIKSHTGENPYKCTYCDYSTVRNSHLILHIRKHTGEKPFKCDECDYSATQKSGIISHKRRHRREKNTCQ